MVRIVVGGQTMLVEPKVALHVRKIVVKNAARSREIERELKQEHLGPSFSSNQFAGWRMNESPSCIPYKAVKSSDDKFREFLAQNRSEEIASKHTF